ncbi:MAG: SPOR domain-containing protein [Pseudomonadota bacterium]
MKKQTHSSLIVASVLFLSAATSSAYAEMQYWVSVHSFSTEQKAQSTVAKLDQQLTERFQVVGASTNSGYYYRVASGPYQSRVMAEEQVRSARALGYTGAWLWSDDSDAFAQAVRPTAGFSDFGSTDDLSGLDDDYTFSDLPEYDDSDTNLGGDTSDADLLQQRQPPPELVEEAPTGYKLNQLHRDS